MAGGQSKDGEPEFQVAPMVDVLLTILVFFMMITSAQVLKVDRTIHLPVAPDAIKADTKRNQIVINVRWHPDVKKPEYVIDDHSFPTADATAPAVRAAKLQGEKKITQAESPTFRAVIRGDQDLPALYISQVMNICGQSGITDISFSTLNK